jgi:hypothetical protein
MRSARHPSCAQYMVKEATSSQESPLVFANERKRQGYMLKNRRVVPGKQCSLLEAEWKARAAY